MTSWVRQMDSTYKQIRQRPEIMQPAVNNSPNRQLNVSMLEGQLLQKRPKFFLCMPLDSLPACNFRVLSVATSCSCIPIEMQTDGVSSLACFCGRYCQRCELSRINSWFSSTSELDVDDQSKCRKNFYWLILLIQNFCAGLYKLKRSEVQYKERKI